jgi:predicted nucleic acid-binding protein
LIESNTYTVDTISLLCYLADKLPRKVDQIFKRAEDEEAILVVPSIILGEAILTLLKGRAAFGVKIPLEKLTTFLEVPETSRTVRQTDLTVRGWKLITTIDLPELHDRIVVSTYTTSNSAAILTDDEEIQNLANVKTIWA